MTVNLQKKNPWRSKKYTDWVKSLPSCISGRPADDAHHIKSPGFGGSVKCSDVFTIPLTRAEHREFHAIGWGSWETKYNVNQLELALRTIERAVREGVLK